MHLATFASCTAMLDRLRPLAAATVGPYGWSVAGSDGRGAPGAVNSAPVATAAPLAAGSTGAAAGSPAPTPAFSSTNDQEQGVDEPDLVKTDGHMIVTLRTDVPGVQITTLDPTARLRGFLALPTMQPSGLLLDGGDAVVIGQHSAAPVPGAGPAPYVPATEVVVVDLTNLDDPTVARTFTVTGSEVDARLVGSTVELVVRNVPAVPFTPPVDASTASRSAAAAANRSAALATTPAEWLPVVTSQPGDVRTVAPCTSAGYLTGTSGGQPSLGSVSVVPIDPSASSPGPAATVFADATTVYADTTSFYVAASPTSAVAVGLPVAGGVGTAGGGTAIASLVGAPDQPAVTDIARFDLSDPASPRYAGSGEVPGSLIGQYALSEYDGDLRVATTVGQATPPPNEGTAPVTASDNRVTVLHFDGGSARVLGTVVGLGAGEKIYAVRFMGPLAYVVTFRQTDPLYVVDLGDPASPHTSGQLPLTGYSSFLQPLSGDELLGIGQGVDASLRTTGLQLSLFDVHDPGNPALLARQELASASSVAQYDPHALLYWSPADLVVLPVSQYQSVPPGSDRGAPGEPFDGAVAYRVQGGSLVEVGRIVQPAATDGSGGGSPPVPLPGPMYGPAGEPVAVAPYGGTDIERALVVGSKLVTVSAAGVLVSDLASFATVAWLPYP